MNQSWILYLTYLQSAVLRSGEIPLNYKIDWNDSLTVSVLKLLRLEPSFLTQR
ncbi:hypothetical protein [Nostoc sp.]|uniref:hypothetical protein n=1 Tax=Nostoc sp. TaxID=1180 RepID=UPI002FFADC54